MDLYGVPVALYGKFLSRPRGDFVAAIEARGGAITRDLTRRSQMLVVGHGAAAAIADGRLATRLEKAALHDVPVCGEAAFWNRLEGLAAEPQVYPIERIGTDLAPHEILLLAIFDLIVLGEGGKCRFADVEVIRSAARLSASGRTIDRIIVTLQRAGKSPRGRRKLVAGPAGEAVLEWDDGVTTLEGQGLLPIAAEAIPSADDLFEQAMEAEEDGDSSAAERLYAACTRADRRDPIAPFNLANLLGQRGAIDDAVIHYRLAIARDPTFVEAYYNLAKALEARGDVTAAESALEKATRLDRSFADALFNLAQLKLRRDAFEEARQLFQRYLQTDPPEDWALKAKKSITFIDVARASR